VELRLHAAETVAAEIEWREVGFEVEARNFGCEPRFVGVFQDFKRDRSGAEVSIDEKHFLLRSDARFAALNSAVVQHECERAQIFEKRLHEFLRLPLVNTMLDVMLTH
jgi:hypothetical protein